MDPLLELARTKGLLVVEDAAQAHGTLYQGHPCGSLGAVACFSFYPGKNLGAYGDGGMVTTNDPGVVERTRLLRNYGERAKYDHVVKGVNSRLDGLQAAFLAVKLQHVPSWNEARRRHADAYIAELEGVGDLEFQKRSESSTHVYHLFIVETEERDALRAFLTERGIQTGIHYPIPIHLQEAYRDLGLRPGTFPHAERLARRALSLPMYPELAEEQIALVADVIRDFFASGRSR
jgi:dTDP-4-amino-4,6-dideoxygalactose transaminase